MNSKPGKLYPDSGVELSPFTAKHYDQVMNIGSIGLYRGFIHRAIRAMDIQRGDKILDLGCGSGRNACIMAKYIGDNGKITGMDLSEIMEQQFYKKCANYSNIKFIRQRIDLPFSLPEQFDKIFMSFVLHGFPQNIRQTVLENIAAHLKPSGVFFMLDFAEFDMNVMPPLYRIIFKKIECQYAFDFIARDWKQILADYRFVDFEEFFFFKNYVRLLKAVKFDSSKNNRLRIAIPTNDGKTIFPKMLGMAQKIFIYEIKDGATFQLVEQRNNPFAKTMQHLKTLDVYELINDCSIIISAHIGKKGITRLQEKGMKLFFKNGDIQEALFDIIKNQTLNKA